MTDKQIIIDGIDVSGCDCYCDGKCLCEYNEINRKIIRYYSCNKFPNCYYKQLKAKEQECEEFRKANDEKNELLAKLGCPTTATARRKVFCLQEQLDQLKAENEELKRYKPLFEKTRDLWNKASKTNYKLLDKIEDLKDSLKRTICQSECYRYKEAEKLKQNLADIKEMAERDKEFCTQCNGDKEIDCIDCIEGGRALLAKDILQKISEVEE